MLTIDLVAAGCRGLEDKVVVVAAIATPLEVVGCGLGVAGDAHAQALGEELVAADACEGVGVVVTIDRCGAARGITGRADNGCTELR